ncbi:MAG TPA: hypothetical protein VK879_07925 [Candidatus Sulfomarinibacteraceae bacterium]|nr:hypothetical protein [Candidatus Sulfomarinibacteraceae bacterium]
MQADRFGQAASTRAPLVSLVIVLLLLATVAACGRSAPGGDGHAATVEALAALAAQTATAEAQTGALAATQTALPPTETATLPPTPTEEVVEVTATPDLAGTAAVEAAATDTAAAPILAQLPTYGVDPANGRLAWTHPPVTIQASGYLSYTYANQHIATVAQDFVVSADVTWNTRFGTAGCGYVLRSDGDTEGNYDQYVALFIRGGSGELFFAIMQDGEVLRNEITNINANAHDPAFEWQNDTTNRFTVVGRGNTFSFYSNGSYLGDVTPSVAYERGFIAFVGLNESGTTMCRYDDAWLWLIE